MPTLRGAIRSGDGRRGGALGRPLDELFEEVAFIAYHFHWPYDEIMSLEHVERRRWADEISQINERANRDAVEVDAWR